MGGSTTPKFSVDSLGNITVSDGLLQSSNYAPTIGSQIDLANSTMTFGGSTDKTLHFDGTNFQLGAGTSTTAPFFFDGVDLFINKGSITTSDYVTASGEKSATGLTLSFTPTNPASLATFNASIIGFHPEQAGNSIYNAGVIGIAKFDDTTVSKASAGVIGYAEYDGTAGHEASGVHGFAGLGRATGVLGEASSGTAVKGFIQGDTINSICGTGVYARVEATGTFGGAGLYAYVTGGTATGVKSVTSGTNCTALDVLAIDGSLCAKMQSQADDATTLEINASGSTSNTVGIDVSSGGYGIRIYTTTGIPLDVRATSTSSTVGVKIDHAGTGATTAKALEIISDGGDGIEITSSGVNGIDVIATSTCIGVNVSSVDEHAIKATTSGADKVAIGATVTGATSYAAISSQHTTSGYVCYLSRADYGIWTDGPLLATTSDSTAISGISTSNSTAHHGVKGKANDGYGVVGEVITGGLAGGYFFYNVGAKWGKVATSAYSFYSAANAGKIYVIDGNGPFTGFHLAAISDTENCSIGDIAVDSSVLFKRDISNVTCVCENSTSTNQKNIIGVYSTDKRTPTEDMTEDYLLFDGYKIIDINAVGEGQINVCGENGDIEAGDYITTSSIPGKGMKQNDDILHNYTVAKSREDVTFSSTTEVKMIACTYHCG